MTSAPDSDPGDKSSRPGLWMAIAGVCAVAAVGLGVWAFTLKSDLDDAEATIARQTQQLASSRQRIEAQRQDAAKTEASEKAFGERAVARYRRVRAHLLKEEQSEANLAQQVKTEAAQLQQARSQTASADTAEERAAAQLRQARRESRLAAACARGSVAAFNEFFNASDADAGANAALRKLEQLQDDCEAALQ